MSIQLETCIIKKNKKINQLESTIEEGWKIHLA